MNLVCFLTFDISQVSFKHLFRLRSSSPLGFISHGCEGRGFICYILSLKRPRWTGGQHDQQCRSNDSQSLKDRYILPGATNGP
ncbi:Peptide chain release factor 1 [Caligus rogercresseyi]|uniref:Peptide chain release factor 1 n=1 Tax=Caligus rogercresseyi TaxID=217165 RepID=A0A7T8GRR1_CALRO|nr:Peptide chain release factor 1 [Caligus rogercresseyi]